jgi:hypothetical protein
MSRVVKKAAPIDMSRIIGDKRSFDFTEDEAALLTELMIRLTEHQDGCPDPEVIESKEKLSKNMKKRLRKKIKNTPLFEEEKEGDRVAGILKEVTSNLGIDSAFAAAAPAAQPASPALNTLGFSWPEALEFGGVLWTKNMTLPPIIERLCKGIRALFNSIRDSDIRGQSVMLFPPDTPGDTLITTLVPRASHSSAARVVVSLGSAEFLNFKVTQGKISASGDLYIMRDQAVLLNFGVCSTVNFSYDNSSSFIYKLTSNSRGLKRTKQPERRWIIVVDYASDVDAITREIEKASAEAAGGDSELQKSIQDRLGAFTSDIDNVVEAAKKKVQAKN